jgi:hypothetical protein
VPILNEISTMTRQGVINPSNRVMFLRKVKEKNVWQERHSKTALTKARCSGNARMLRITSRRVLSCGRVRN